MSSFISNIRDAYASKESADRGTIIETVFMAAAFAVVAILVASWITTAVAGNAANTATCISVNQADPVSANSTCATEKYDTKQAVKNKISSEKSNRF